MATAARIRLPTGSAKGTPPLMATDAASYVATLVAPVERPLTDDDIERARTWLTGLGANPGEWRWLRAGVALDIAFAARAHPPSPDQGPLDGVDFCLQPAEGRRKQVLVADMDSTMIEIETLDTLAAEFGLGPKVVEITERTMKGELDFVASLRARVALLEGYPAQDAMAAVLAQVRYSLGGRIAVRTMVEHGAQCALVSGGFTFTTEIVHQALGFQTHRANSLEIGADGAFTGQIGPAVVGPDTKLETMKALCAKLGVPLSAACAVGDGANDLDMLSHAGLGVAYYGKPIVHEKARFRIDHTDLTSLLYFQGYGWDAFVRD
ncbi:MAG: phosphoserine phosphatase SerB [Alphaproteobacteria bacterium]|nr:phosphoserine phosphatase SerB [Alphaproteobacteria bacterium]